ncbi:MAG: hypothetical protein A2V96_00315 [Candidatus Yonathbacteria bacterium RBG_16_43_6]|uniref:UPF0102 protein A3B07_00415 n=1 Tax=Candidatus Yonathbacteria bacterium RIFCSPLOWO2_01_FULL_43_27 TaxID=1802726 RepID=A0A1G2SDS4_9BACT|nr:MAG: hypothetical protein A2658_00925 [Candidatus Yonathbacteria bacterium RIFCSPHIGHO2_01_FULL_44_19]OHA79676.1 MAG: hypothetical protein A2V96_00315 [Candidatus Yonathbacteria bacterium RBG_16_43_6]OHA83217.1 MAG: hypothetical protein A3B07_00415 [Candidatus Yonathbacteria bacterium RIFCSPLOWO2_01_FULL_43_27]
MTKDTESRGIGRLGEDIAVKHLENKGFTTIERNYLKKYGEIDIIAKKGDILHFIEVKSVSCENNPSNVPRATTDNYRPEDNIHTQKIKRLSRTIQAYLLSNYQNKEPAWVFDVVTIKIDMINKRAYVKFLEDLVL